MNSKKLKTKGKHDIMKRRMMFAVAAAILSAAPGAMAQSTDSGNSTLSVSFGPEASISITNATTTLSKSGTKFESFTGTTNFSYKIRTTQTSGTGSITVQVTTFSTDGPAVADLSYTCTDTASGTPCSTTGASSSSGTNVVSFGADVHSADGGDAASVTWTLVDRTGIKTGAYNSTATYTISAS
jgi:hypothetical protein